MTISIRYKINDYKNSKSINFKEKTQKGGVFKKEITKQAQKFMKNF